MNPATSFGLVLETEMPLKSFLSCKLVVIVGTKCERQNV